MAEERGRIVVGVDGSKSSCLALRWAQEQARLRNASLHVIYGHPASYAAPHGPSVPGMLDALANWAGRPERVLEDSLAGVLDGDVAVQREVVRAPPVPALLEAARGAELLVVGARGHGGFAGLLVGSVSLQCAAHAPCPVAVVRPNGSRRAGRTPASHQAVDAASARPSSQPRPL